MPETDAGIVLTAHALERYRRRADATATAVDVAGLLARGRLSHTPPAAGQTARGDAFLIVGRGRYFPLVRDGDVFVAVTFRVLERRSRRSKADRRAWREQRAADDEALS